MAIIKQFKPDYKVSGNAAVVKSLFKRMDIETVKKHFGAYQKY